jgi:hypothetical protein
MSGTRSLGTASRITVNQSEHKFVPEHSTLFEFQWNFIVGVEAE